MYLKVDATTLNLSAHMRIFKNYIYAFMHAKQQFRSVYRYVCSITITLQKIPYCYGFNNFDLAISQSYVNLLQNE